MLERELADFGARIGIPNLAWGEGDALTLTFDDLGSLTLACPQSEDDDFLLSFSRPARPDEARRAFWAFLRAAHWTSRQPYALAAGMHNDRWILGIKLHDLTVQNGHQVRQVHGAAHVAEAPGVDDLQGLQPDLSRQNFALFFVHGVFLPFLHLNCTPRGNLRRIGSTGGQVAEK